MYAHFLNCAGVHYYFCLILYSIYLATDIHRGQVVYEVNLLFQLTYLAFKGKLISHIKNKSVCWFTCFCGIDCKLCLFLPSISLTILFLTVVGKGKDLFKTSLIG